MAYRVICGIYAATTPGGNQYIGSSRSILKRWSEHRRMLRGGRHHSPRLQAAWDKYGEDRIRWTVLLECKIEDLERMEQAVVDRRRPRLNILLTIGNVWSDPATAAKLAASFASPEYVARRKEVGMAHAVPVDCSNGVRYESQKAAALAFGLKAAGINALVKTQRAGRLGVRFKRADEEWRDVLKAQDARVLSRIKSGGTAYSVASRAKMSESARRSQAARQRDGAGRYA